MTSRSSDNPSKTLDQIKIEALIAERDRYLEALRHLANPNWSAPARGIDAKDMAFYARNVLVEAGRGLGS